MTRKDQIFDLANFKIGCQCGTKNGIADLAGVPRQSNFQEWAGYIQFSNCLPLFVTLDKSNRPKYHDKFDGGLFYWDSKSNASISTPDIQALIEQLKPVVLFARCRGHESFIYCGRLTLKGQPFGGKPVHFVWELLDFPEGLGGNEHLDLLAAWIPEANTATSKWRGNAHPKKKKSFSEGAKRPVTGNYFERDPAARYECIKAHGCKCWVCDFDFSQTYGSMGDEFIFVHHRVPVPVRAQKGQYVLVPERDLVPLCGNCHYIVHRKRAVNDGGIRPGTLKEHAMKKLKELQELAVLEFWEDTLD